MVKVPVHTSFYRKRPVIKMLDALEATLPKFGGNLWVKRKDGLWWMLSKNVNSFGGHSINVAPAPADQARLNEEYKAQTASVEDILNAWKKL